MNWMNTVSNSVTDFTFYYSGLFSPRVVRVGCKRSTAKSRNDLKTIWNGLDCHQQKGDFINMFWCQVPWIPSFITAVMKTTCSKCIIINEHKYIPRWGRLQVCHILHNSWLVRQVNRHKSHLAQRKFFFLLLHTVTFSWQWLWTSRICEVWFDQKKFSCRKISAQTWLFFGFIFTTVSRSCNWYAHWWL